MTDEPENAEPSEDEPSTIRLTFLPLAQPTLPSLDALNEALGARGQAPLVADWSEDPEESAGEGEHETLFFRFEGLRAFASLFPAPFPWTDLEGPCETAWWWPDASETLRDHQAHLVLSLMENPGDPIDQALRMTRLTAVVLEASGALAVYWPEAPLVQSRAAFLQDSALADRDALPVHLWVDLRVFSTEPGTVSVFTAGLAALGAMEIEVRRTSVPPEEALGMVGGLVSYLADRGPVIKDGDTVGGSAEERITARHLPSEWERDGDVLVVEM
jgi:uncharacterized protein DUF4261